MERHPKTLADANELLQVSELLTASVRTVINEWTNESLPSTSPAAARTSHFLPAPALHQAQRTILAIAGKLTELVSEPCSRVLEVACQYCECRALSIAAERRVPDLLAVKGEEGVEIKGLAEATGIDDLKLCTFHC